MFRKVMKGKSRSEAGKILAEKLKQFKAKDVIVYAIPRGGVIVGMEIAKKIHAPLDLLIARKICDPNHPEYAIAATTENGCIVGDHQKIEQFDHEWLVKEVSRQHYEASVRRKRFTRTRKRTIPEHKIALIVDDGAATGLTLLAAIRELKQYNPEEIILAVPVMPESTAHRLELEVDHLVTLTKMSKESAIDSGYYTDSQEVEDAEVVKALDIFELWLANEQGIDSFGKPFVN